MGGSRHGAAERPATRRARGCCATSSTRASSASRRPTSSSARPRDRGRSCETPSTRTSSRPSERAPAGAPLLLLAGDQSQTYRLETALRDAGAAARGAPARDRRRSRRRAADRRAGDRRARRARRPLRPAGCPCALPPRTRAPPSQGATTRARTWCSRRSPVACRSSTRRAGACLSWWARPGSASTSRDDVGARRSSCA